MKKDDFHEQVVADQHEADDHTNCSAERCQVAATRIPRQRSNA